jgi:hypothetical protein
VNASTKQTQGIEDKPTSIRERLEDILTQLYTVLDVCFTCHRALDEDDSVASVLSEWGPSCPSLPSSHLPGDGTD